jgi:hypothetical protein
LGIVDRRTSLQELAAIVSQTLEKAGISATLSGGGAVSLYSDNQYSSLDLDFVTSERNAVIAKAMEPLGFRYEAGTREFLHPDSDYYVEFPPGPLAFGETVVSNEDAAMLQTQFGPLRIVTPTQSVMDRLAAYVAWHDNQAFDQAVLVAGRQPIDWPALRKWSEGEGLHAEVVERLRRRSNQD